LTFKVQKGRGLGSRDPISKFWDPPYKFGTNRDICFKFGTDIDDGPLLRPDHKTTPKWAWPRSRDPMSKFWDPLITFKRIKLPASNLVLT